MKLIKQNDSAGGLIFKQNQNGKAMKQNYNFGKAFNLAFSNSINIEIPFVHNLGDPFTVLFWAKNNTPSSGRIPTLTTNLGGDNLRILVSSSGSTNQAYYNGMAVNMGTGDGHVFGYKRGNIGAGVGIWKDAQYPIGGSASVNSITKIILTGVTAAGCKVTTVAIFKRELSQSELSYFYNNRLGNELLSVNGLYGLYPLSISKVLNNGTGDFVGMDNEYDNANNAIITGLPAGTLEEQRDYANANLFETW